MSYIRFRKTPLAIAILSLGLTVTLSAFGQGTGTSPSTAPSATPRTADKAARSADNGKLASKERKFIEEAAIGGMAEVQFGKLAEEKAASQDVKQFGSRMVQDHGKANEELKQIASAKGVNVPTALDRKHQREYERLQKLSGAEFDKEYMKHMVSDHKKDISDFRSMAKSANDPDLKSFASKTLPTLEEHLKMAQAAESATKGRTGGTAATTRSTTERPQTTTK